MSVAADTKARQSERITLRGGLKDFALVLLVMVASLVVLVIPNIVNPSWRSAAFVGLAMGAFYIINFWLIIPYQLSKAFKQNENLRKERIVRISSAAVTLQIGDRTTEFSWEHFQKVLESNNFFLMIYKAEERIYPFLPARVFQDETTKDDFLALLEEKSIPVK